MSKGAYPKPSLAVDYVAKLMDNIYDMIENRNFAGKKLSTSEQEKGQAATIVEKYGKIYSALDAQNKKNSEKQIGRQYQSQMRELILSFGEASDDSLKQMVEAVFKKKPEYKKQVYVTLFHTKCSLKKLKQIEAIVRVPSHISIESKIKEDLETKFAYESFFREEDFSRLEAIFNSVKQLSIKKGMKKFIELKACTLKLEKQLNQYTQYSKDSNVKHLEWERRLVEPVLKLKQKVWHLKAYEQHFEWLVNTLNSLSRGEIVDINQKKSILTDRYMENSLNILFNQMKLSVQKSKQMYNRITGIINTYKFENDPILTSSGVDNHKLSSKITEVILNNRIRQIEKTIRIWFQFGNQAKIAVLESSQDMKMTQSPLKESDLKEILAFIKKRPQKIYSSRISFSPNLSKNNSQISSPDEYKNEELALVKQTFIENCKLILPEIAQDNQYCTSTQICSIYLQRNNEIKKRIKNLVNYETQATQLDWARQELEKEIELREKTEIRVKQMKEQHQRLSQQHSCSGDYLNSLIQQKDNQMNKKKQKQAEFTDQLIERQRQIGELTSMKSQQQSIIDLLTQQLTLLQNGQPSEQLDALKFKLNETIRQLSVAQNQIIKAQGYIDWLKEQIGIHNSNNQELKSQLQQTEQNLQELKLQIGKCQSQKVYAESKAADSFKQLKQQHEREKSELSIKYSLDIDYLKKKLVDSQSTIQLLHSITKSENQSSRNILLQHQSQMISLTQRYKNQVQHMKSILDKNDQRQLQLILNQEQAETELKQLKKRLDECEEDRLRKEDQNEQNTIQIFSLYDKIKLLKDQIKELRKRF